MDSIEKAGLQLQALDANGNVLSGIGTSHAVAFRFVKTSNNDINPIFNFAVSADIKSTTSGTADIANSVSATASITGRTRTIAQSLDDRGISIRDPYGAVGDGVTDDTAAVQRAVDACVASGKCLLVPPGVYLVGPINLNGSTTSTPANSQWAGVKSIIGLGRFDMSVFKAKSGLYGSTDYVLSLRNVAGCQVSGISVDGNNVATNGINFSWTGTALGGVAPSNLNVYENIAVQGCSDISINLDQCHDSKLSGICVRDSTNIGISMIGAGGMFTASDILVSNGIFRIGCQNASIVGYGFYGGLELTGGGYNSITFIGGQIYGDASAGVAINSTATGNATRGVTFNDLFIPSCTTVIQGRFWQGMTFQACHLGAYTNVFGTVTPAAGTGFPPTFAFIHSDFDGTTPINVASHLNVYLEFCRQSDGTMISTPINASALAGTLTVSQLPATLGGFAVGSSGQQGLQATWNLSGGFGEGDLIIGYGGGGSPEGPGGLNIYTYDNLGSGTKTLIGRVCGNGKYISTGGIGAYGVSPPTSQPATPTTLADVIAIIRGCGLSV